MIRSDKKINFFLILKIELNWLIDLVVKIKKPIVSYEKRLQKMKILENAKEITMYNKKTKSNKNLN